MPDEAGLRSTYFFCCALPLEVGSIINPGNWGRMLKLYTPQMNGWLLARELIYEQVRREFFPDKPSRFDSTFVCLSEDDLRQFCKSNSRIFDIHYEVEVLDKSASYHLGDWSFITMPNNNNYYDFSNQAHRYWEAKENKNLELVLTSPIRIIKLL